MEFLSSEIENLKKFIKEKEKELNRLKSLIADVPFVIGMTYTTSSACPEQFTISKINYNKDGEVIGFWGIYETRKHLGICPLHEKRSLLSRTGKFLN